MVLNLFCFVIRGLVVQNEGINYPTALKVPSLIKKTIIFLKSFIKIGLRE